MKFAIKRQDGTTVETYECNRFESYPKATSGQAGFIRLYDIIADNGMNKKERTVALIPNNMILERVS